MSTNSNPKASPGIWTIETPWQFPVPKEDETEDPWPAFAKEKHNELEDKFTNWKDELQSLLTFTGLFSAVVAGFLAATYQNLSADPADATNALLTQIAQRLDVSLGLANSSSLLPLSPSPPFTPPHFLVRVHTFWFLSLTFSLSAAIISILCLQWIRQQQYLPNAGSDQKAFIISSVRMESFNHWHVPAIIAYLPTSLQVSLILFFIGMVYFVLPFGKEISIPTIVIISATFTFLLWTTIAPTIQGIYFFASSKISHFQQYPCPYRSPQAWRFYVWAMPIVVIVLPAIILTIGTIIVSLPVLLISLARGGTTSLRTTGTKMYRFIELVTRAAFRVIAAVSDVSSHDWRMTDIQWLRCAPPLLFGLRFSDASVEEDSALGWYCATQGLLGISSSQLDPARALYSSMQTIPNFLSSKSLFPRPTHTSLAADGFNANIVKSRLLTSWSDPNPTAIHAEYRMLVNNMFRPHASASYLQARLHQLDVYIRILETVYAGPNWMTCAPGAPGFTNKTFIPGLLRPSDRRKLPSVTGGDVCLEQLVLIWASFVANLLEHKPPLGRHHRPTDIEALNIMIIPAFSEFINISDETSSSIPSAAILNSIQTFTRIHHLLSSFLGTSLRNVAAGLPYQTDPFPIIWLMIYQYLLSCLVEGERLGEWGQWKRAPLKWTTFDRISRRLADSGDQRGIIQGYISSFKNLFQLADTMIEVMAQDNTTKLDDVNLELDHFSAKKRLALLNEMGMTRFPNVGVLANLPLVNIATGILSSPDDPETSAHTALDDVTAPHLVPLPPDTAIPAKDVSTSIAPIDTTSTFPTEVQGHIQPVIVIVPDSTPPPERTENTEVHTSTNVPPNSTAPYPSVYPTPLLTPPHGNDTVIDMAFPFPHPLAHRDRTDENPSPLGLGVALVPSGPKEPGPSDHSSGGRGNPLPADQIPPLMSDNGIIGDGPIS